MPDLGQVLYEAYIKRSTEQAMRTSKVFFAASWSELDDDAKNKWRHTAEDFARFLS